MRSLKIDRPLNSLSEAEGAIGEGGTRDYNCLGFDPPCQTEVSKAIGVQSPLCLPCHPSWTVQMVLHIQDKAGDIGRRLA